jgi:hypothetical protein
VMKVKSQNLKVKDIDNSSKDFSLFPSPFSISFSYDGWNSIAEFSTGDSPSTNYFTWGLDLSGSLQGAGGVGGLLSTVQDGDIYFSCFDANGNVTEYVDDSGDIVAHYEYNPFGGITLATGDKKDDFNFRFSTKYLDTETGLYYYGNRSGKFIGVNNGDLTANGIPDFADGMNIYGNSGAGRSHDFARLMLQLPKSTDVTTARVRFKYSGSDPDNVLQSGDGTSASPYVYTPADGHLRLWLKNGSEDRKVAQVGQTGGDFIASNVVYDVSDLGFSATQNVVTIYMEGISNSATCGDQKITVEVDPNSSSESPDFIPGDVVRATIIKVDLIPDYNRDGTINQDDKTEQSASNPYRFWINDDNDDPQSEVSGDDASGASSPDYSDDKIDGLRDMIDFFPVWLDIKDALDVLPAAEYEYLLKHSAGAFNIFADTQCLPSQANHHLVDEAFCTANKNASLKQVTVNGYTDPGNTVSTIPDSVLSAIAAGSERIILLESKAATSVPLVLEIKKKSDGQSVFEKEMPISVSAVADLFRYRNLRGTGGDRLGVPLNYPDTLCEEKNFIFMHGYNVTEEAAKASQAEVFKRLWSSGYDGKFWGVSWNGTPPAFGTLKLPHHYHNSILEAFAVASSYATFLNGLNGPVDVLAHSAGNVVTSSAINDHSANVRNYYALDAAVALEAYGAVTPDAAMISDNFLDQNDEGIFSIHGWGWHEYPSDMYSAEWYRLFLADDDNRKNLTWRNRFGNVQTNTSAYNLYSSSEDVLRVNSGYITFISGITKKYSWQIQEFFKGRDYIPGSIAGAASKHAGWEFATESEMHIVEFLGVDLHPVSPEHVINKLTTGTPEEIAAYREGLKTDPLFRHNPAILYTANGSTFAGGIVRDYKSKLYDYTPSGVEDIPVRDWLLAKAFPSVSRPMGANNNTEWDFITQNFNMPDLFNGNGWPATRGGEWWHSDFKDVAYLYVFELYQSLTSLSN